MSNYSGTTSQLFRLATAALNNARGAANRVGATRPPNLKEQVPRHNVSKKEMPRPVFSDMFAGVDLDTGADVISIMNDKVDAWLAKYFPSINGQLKNVPEDWLVGVISGVKPFGIDSTVFELVWQQARDRAYRTASSERRSLEASFSQRGFSLPPGALVDVLAQSEQRGMDSIMDVNRDQAVKDAEIKQDILKYAVGISAQLKQGILSTSAEFFKVYLSTNNNNLELARIRAGAYATYYNALTAYYGVEVSWEELRLRAAEAEGQANASIDRNRVANHSGTGENAAHATASTGFSDAAAGAAAAAGSLVAEIESL